VYPWNSEAFIVYSVKGGINFAWKLNLYISSTNGQDMVLNQQSSDVVRMRNSRYRWVPFMKAKSGHAYEALGVL